MTRYIKLKTKSFIIQNLTTKIEVKKIVFSLLASNDKISKRSIGKLKIILNISFKTNKLYKSGQLKLNVIKKNYRFRTIGLIRNFYKYSSVGKKRYFISWNLTRYLETLKGRK